MKSYIGNNIVFSLFGESHSDIMGITINGLPSGIKIDKSFIKEELKRRKPLKEISNARIEDDEFEIISGLFEDFTTSFPLTITIKNKNYNSSNYEKGLIRPSHADLPAYIRTNGCNDYRGGGHFSGRLTALLVVAGAICKEVLKIKYPDIKIGSHLYSIGSIFDEDINENNKNKLYTNAKMLDEEKYSEAIKTIITNKEKKDSLGGVVEGVVEGMPTGVGEPFFDSLEAVISHYLFSIPGVKGVIFGDGLEMAYLNGSKVNDMLKYENSKVIFLSNHNGGINGGLSNGEMIRVKTYFKPTPTIGLKQNTINVITKENITYEFKGNHDTCYAVRCDVIVESVIAMAILDLLISYSVMR